MFPTQSERLRIAQLCKGIGLAVDVIKQLFTGEAITVNGKLYSPEHDRDFDVQNATLQLFKEKGNSYKLRLNINVQNILDWFKPNYQEV